MTVAIVIGGGISGIAAAARLKERGIKASIFEADAFLSGRIGTRPHGSSEFDLGGRNFGSYDDDLLGLLRSFGVHRLSDYRFNTVGIGWLPHFDMRSGGSRTTKVKRLLKNLVATGATSPTGVSRILDMQKSARKAGARHLGTSYWDELAKRTSDPSVSDYVGHAVAERMVRPWTLRMMASEPEEVFIGNLAPLLGVPSGAAMKRVEGGMGVLMRAVEEKFDVRRNHRVTSVLIEGGRVVGVEGTNGERSFREKADVVVVTAPASDAADLLERESGLAAALRTVAYRPVATVVAEYTYAQFPGDMTGLFLPRGYAVCHIARYESANRIRFSFAGVEARKAFASMTLDGLLYLGEATFKQVGGKLGHRYTHIGNVWRPGLCGHSRMHHETVARILEHSAKIRGLVLTGDYFRGNMLGACVRAAKENVDRELDYRPASGGSSDHDPALRAAM